MIHRRTFVDDRYGVGEALDEHAFGVPLVVRGKHLLYYGSQANGEDPVEIDVSLIFCAIHAQYQPLQLQLDKLSVVEPTWLPNYNREASLPGHERLKDQLQESG